MSKSPNAILCEAGDAQAIVIDAANVATATLVIGEEYRIFGPANCITVIGYADPLTVGNIVGVIGPGGWLDHKATAVSLLVSAVDAKAANGTGLLFTAYAVKISDNA